MKAAAFDYCRPDTLDEAVQLLHEYGADASVLAGGMSLGAMLNMRLARPAVVVDIKRISQLKDIAGTEFLCTGAAVRQADAMEHAGLMAAVPLLALALPFVGHFQTRNRGTLGGSAAHADPSAEVPLALATLGGEVELRSAQGVRRLKASEFFVDALVTARKPDEILTALFWPRAPAGAGHAFDEIAQRHGDFAIVACAAQAELAGGKLETLRLGIGGVETRPIVVEAGEYAGERADAKLAARIAEDAAAAATPLHDYKASADYRRALVRAIGARVLERAFAAAGNA